MAMKMEAGLADDCLVVMEMRSDNKERMRLPEFIQKQNQADWPSHASSERGRWLAFSIRRQRWLFRSDRLIGVGVSERT